MGFDVINKIEIERFSVTSSKPFDQLVAAINAAIGHPDIVEFERSPRRPALSESKKDSYGGT
jgi:hypothetical protein